MARHIKTESTRTLGSFDFPRTKILYQNNCPRMDFAQKAKSRGDTLVTRAYILTVEIYTQYARKNLDLLERGSRGISRKYEMVRMA